MCHIQSPPSIRILQTFGVRVGLSIVNIFNDLKSPKSKHAAASAIAWELIP